MQVGVIHKLEPSRFDFLDGKHRVHATTVFPVVFLHMTTGVVDHAVDAAALQGPEDLLVHQRAGFGVEVMQVAEGQHHVCALDVEFERLEVGQPIGAAEFGVFRGDLHLVEAGLTQQVLFNSLGAHRQNQLARVSQYRGQQLGVPPAPGQQFNDLHVFF